MANRRNRRRNASTAQTAEEQESFVQRHLRPIAGACIVIVLIVLAVVLGRIALNKRGEKAQAALYPCELYFQQGNYQNALEGDGQQCEGLLVVASRYSHTKAGNLAKLYAGLSYAQLGQYEDAKAFLAKFSTKRDQMISPAAIAALGNTYVQLGEQEKGAETLVKAAKRADNSVLSPIFLVQAGEIYEALGQPAKALELYQLVKSNYRASVQGTDIDRYIQRASLSL